MAGGSPPVPSVGTSSAAAATRSAERAGSGAAAPSASPSGPTRRTLSSGPAAHPLRHLDGTTHSVTVAAIEIRELHLCSSDGGCFMFQLDPGEPC